MMKVQFKLAMAAAAALMIGLTGCNKEGGPDGPEGGEEKSVLMKISYGQEYDNALTRGTGQHVANGAAVSFGPTHLFFTTATGTVVWYRSVTTTGTPSTDLATSIDIKNLENGAALENIPGTAMKVYLMSNLPGTFTAPTLKTTNISAYAEAVIGAGTQYDATAKGVAKVTLYGAGSVVPDGSGFKAQFDFSPVSARMEVGKLTAGGKIKSYKLDGIFVNNYYGEMKANGSFSTAANNALVNNGSTVASYLTGAGSYTAALQGAVYDHAAAGIGTKDGLVTWPLPAKAATDVWGYNLPAPTGAAMAHIVVRLSSVVLDMGGVEDATSYAGPQFLTVRNFYSDAAKTTEINTLSARNVYRIQNLEFTEDNLTPQPELNTKAIAVTVDVKTWISSDIWYDLN